MTIKEMLRLLIVSILLVSALASVFASEDEDDEEPIEELTVVGENQPPSTDDRTFKGPTNQNVGTGGYSPTNSSTDSCANEGGQGCIDYEKTYDPGGPEECAYIRYEPSKGAFAPQIFSQDYNACVLRVIAVKAWEAAAFYAQEGSDAACAQWNAYSEQYDQNDVSDVLRAMRNKAVLMGSAALICGGVAGAMTTGSGPVASGVAMGAAMAFCGVIAADSPELMDAACN